MIRVLHSVGYMHRAGVETMLMNYYRHIDRSRVQFDFLCHKNLPGDYDAEIKKLGGRLFYAPPLGDEPSRAYRDYILGLVAHEPEIRILHAHNGARQFFPLQAVKESGLPVRISHAHGTDLVKNSRYSWKNNLIRKIPEVATAFFACGVEAGRFFFGDRLWSEQGIMINNGIDLEKFSFHPKTRTRIREAYSLSEAHVIGSVGRFEEQKNHTRLIDIFGTVARKDPLAVLVLIGTGKLEAQIREKVAAYGLDGRTLFLGSRDDVQDWYQAMDVMVMPSLFEGLPLTGVEAMAAGLPCVFSDRVSSELAISQTIRYCSLEDSDSVWGDAVLGSMGSARESGISLLRAAGYDISDCAARLEMLYLGLCT